MRKSTIFISAVLTTFALVMLYRVAAAYRDSATVAEAPAQPTATLEPTATEEPEPTEEIITPEAAAQLAAQVLGNSNLLSAESSSFNGVNAYLITFTNEDVVYIGLDGQILSVQIAPVVVSVSVPVSAPVKQKNKNNKNNNNSDNNGGGGGENHEDHEEHEEHED